MKAAVWHGYKDVRIEEVAEPVPKAGQVKIRVDWAGICGTDRHEYEEAAPSDGAGSTADYRT